MRTSSSVWSLVVSLSSLFVSLSSLVVSLSKQARLSLKNLDFSVFYLSNLGDSEANLVVCLEPRRLFPEPRRLSVEPRRISVEPPRLSLEASSSISRKSRRLSRSSASLNQILSSLSRVSSLSRTSSSLCRTSSSLSRTSSGISFRSPYRDFEANLVVCLEPCVSVPSLVVSLSSLVVSLSSLVVSLSKQARLSLENLDFSVFSLSNLGDSEANLIVCLEPRRLCPEPRRLSVEPCRLSVEPRRLSLEASSSLSRKSRRLSRSSASLNQISSSLSRVSSLSRTSSSLCRTSSSLSRTLYGISSRSPYRPEESNDLRNKIRRKSQTIDRVCDSKNDLRSIIEETKVKRVDDSSVQPQLKPRVVNVRDQLNSKSEDLRMKLNRPTRSDLRRKLENDEKPQTSSTPSSSNPGPTEPNLWCSFHKSKAHDTRNFRHLVDALFSSYENGTANVELPKPRQNNTKSWRKNIEKKAHKNPDKAGPLPNVQKMTNQRSRTKTRAKHKSEKRNLVTVDASKLSSNDQVPPLVKKRTAKAATRTNPPTNDQVKTADRESRMT
ncbi:hypothetical protein F2Q69_00024333 [Brassica cretica]|uniref:Uncharacterized protein n=1 Tax=Brassica cretica TaxID=69181 RepID=A0A8S9QNA4_BRACR|nr:hypothetical protein F2Q69_00024333 [Brassica cretica]